MKRAQEDAKNAPVVVIKTEPMPALPERKQFRIGTIKPIEPQSSVPKAQNLVKPSTVRMGSANAVATTKGAVDPQEIVDAHNKHRAMVGVPPLAYSDELEVSAQAWADTLKRNNQCKLKHSETRYGENIFGAPAWSNGPAQVVRSSEVIDAFASEKSDYTYSNNNCTPGRVCGHYTQVVWRNTTHVGCAMAMCDAPKDQVWVCQYNPPGNYVGQKPY